MNCPYSSIPEYESNENSDFVKSVPYDCQNGYGPIFAYINCNIIWENLYYNGFLSESEYNRNPFPL